MFDKNSITIYISNNRTIDFYSQNKNFVQQDYFNAWVASTLCKA